MDAEALGADILARCYILASFTEDPGKVTRTYLTPEHKAANDQVGAWMRAAGMNVRTDEIGNIVGRYEGSRPGAPTLMIGSHLDTVRDAGRYDGILGVVTGLASVQSLMRAQRRLPFAIEIVGFADEEGVRFDAALIGSRAIAGTLPVEIFSRRDAKGVVLRDALTAFGLDEKDVAKAKREAFAYLEVHIEQGPVLEQRGLPVGIVSAIFGATRRRYRLSGLVGHAGTVPMTLRHDALAGAAEAILAAEEIAMAEDVVATVGRINALPGAVNVIPGGAEFTIDVRSEDDGKRISALAKFDARLADICTRRGLTHSQETFHEGPACPCDPALTSLFQDAVARAGITPLRLPSGAGHDLMAVASIAPSAMLFVRCKGGISHNPAEAITAEDAGIAASILSDAINRLAETYEVGNERR